MGRQKVKILSFFLAVFIAVAAFPALKSNAASSIPNSNLSWSLSNGKLTIEGTGNMPQWTGTSQVPWYSSRSNITSVEIKSGVTSIAPYAFRSHGNLTSISIPSTVTSIGAYSFQQCGNLTSITIPNSVTSIGQYAFTQCTKLSSVTLSNKLTYIGNDAFKSSGITSITIPSGVTTIENNTFTTCANLTTVNFPNTLTTIGTEAFKGCKKLNNVTLPSSLITIGDRAFSTCTSLTSISIPSGVHTINLSAFIGCTNLTTVTLPSGLLYLNGSVFQNCTNLSSINIPSGIIYIGESCFDNCTALSSFTIPASVTTFGYDALAGTNVHEVTYYGTRAQWENIETLYDEELDWTMDKEFAKLNIDVVFATGGNDVTITSQPSDFTGKVGTTATFSVRATGDGLTYKWFEFDGSDWSECSYTGHNTSTLKVNITCSKYGYKYGCEVIDSYGHSVTSDNALLIIDKVPLKINIAPSNFSGLAGETATFTVKAQGDELAYQWQVLKDGTWTNCSINDGAKTATLSLEITEARDGSVYRCIISDGYGDSVTTKDVTLTVKPPLAITSQPKDYTGLLGTAASFSVTATGSGLKYQWQAFTNGEWTNCSMNDGAKTDTLTLEATAARDGVKYHCVITDDNQESITTNEVTLNVLFPLEIKTQPSSYQARLGADASFRIEASGTGLKYQWQVFTNGEWINCSMNDGAKTDTLTVSATAGRDGSKYHCVVTDYNQDTMTSNEVTLTVVFPTEIQSQPEDFWCRLGSEAEFTVSATGTGLKYQWQSYTNGEWVNCSMNAGAKTDTLTLEATASRDGVKYHCVITNLFGDVVTTDEATLYVIFPLEITLQPQDVSTTLGSTATFTVAASGEELSYQWQVLKNGEWLNCSAKDGATTDTLTLEAKESRNGLKYRCVVFDVMNEETVISREATLNIDIPLAITTQPTSVTSTANSTVTFTIKASGVGLKYQWQVLKNGTWTNCSINDGSKTAKLTLTATASRNGTKYHCIVTDSTGAKLTSNTAVLTVESPLAITTQPSNFSGSEGATATFNVVATGTGLKYQWQVNKSGSWSNCSMNDGAKTATLTLAATANRNGTKYRCVITDSTGATVTSNTVTLTVDIPLAITSQPTSCTIEGGGVATFTIKANGVGLKYQWQVLKNGTWTNCSMNDGAKTNKLTLEATAARNGTKYHCIVTDSTGAKLTSNTAILTVLIPLEITSQPQNATCANVGDYATYTVEASGTGLKYQWQVFKDGEWTNCSINDGAKTKTLKIEAKENRNGLKYHCVITDSNGATVTSDDAFLKITGLFANLIDLNSAPVTEPIASENEVVIVESDNVSAEETEVIEAEVVETEVVETVVEEVASEAEVFETVDEQVS